MATISSYYFRTCVQGARRRGADVGVLMERAGISPEDANDPNWRGSVESMARLVRQICASLDDEFMGYAEAPVRSGAFGMMAQLAMPSASVLEALCKGLRFYRIVSDAIQTRLDLDGEDLHLTVDVKRPDLDEKHYFLEFWMITWHRFACWMAGEVIGLRAAQFTYERPTEYFEEFKYLFPCHHRFGAAANRITMEVSAIMGPVKRDQDEFREMIARAPLDIMTIPGIDSSIARRVRMLLGSPRGGAISPCSMTVIAGRLGIAPHTLRRALRREGASFSMVLETVRRDTAIRKLLRTRATVEEIAAELGYAEPRSFTRAFRKWTDTSPMKYRRQFDA